jgi:hypothetical protein
MATYFAIFRQADPFALQIRREYRSYAQARRQALIAVEADTDWDRVDVYDSHDKRLVGTFFRALTLDETCENHATA